MTSLPAHLGRYQIQSLLGRGGMGEVYKAFDPGLDRVVALKTIRLDVQNPTLLERLYREAKACGRLRHPRIVTVYDLGEIEGVVFIAMEYLEGENLEAAIAGGALSIQQKFNILVQILEALQYAHGEGVIHRDIKPSNVLVLPDRTVKLLDFGLARVVHADSMTVSGTVLGTPYYMSPEQLKGQRVDPRTDVYSTGVVAYEMLTRRRAFDGDSLTAVMLKVLSEPAPPMATFLSAAFPEIERIITRAIAKSPDDRYATAEEMRAAVEAFVSASRPELARLEADATLRARRAVGDAEALFESGRTTAAEQLLGETLRTHPDATEVRARLERSRVGSVPTADAVPSPDAAPPPAPVRGPAPAPPPQAASAAPAPTLLVTASVEADPPRPVSAPLGPSPAARNAPSAPARPVRPNAWWIGVATTALAAGIVVMLMAVRGGTPIREPVDQGARGRDATGAGSPGRETARGATGPELAPRGSTAASSTPPPASAPSEKQAEPPTRAGGLPATESSGRGPVVGRQSDPQRPPTASPRAATVFLDARRSDAPLVSALDLALKEKGVALSANASTARWSARATIQLSIRKSPIGDTSALTADYEASLELSDAMTGMRRTLQFDGHALDFGEQVVRAAALRRAAEQLAEAIQTATNE